MSENDIAARITLAVLRHEEIHGGSGGFVRIVHRRLFQVFIDPFRVDRVCAKDEHHGGAGVEGFQMGSNAL